jgi:hypothetical protein
MDEDSAASTMTDDEPAEPSSKPAADGPKPISLWEETARPGLPHPTWWHTLNLTTWTGVVGTGVAELHPSTGALLIGTAGAAALGMGIGSAVVHAPAPEYRGLLYGGGVLGTLTGAAMGAWAWIASANDLFNDLFQPTPWIELGAGGAAFGVAYTALRFRIAAARNPHSRLHKRLKIRASSGIWAQIMSEAGFGDCTVVDHTENWSGYKVLIKLDPERKDSTLTVVNAREKLTTIAAKVLAATEEISLAPDALDIQRTTDARIVSIFVRLRAVLTSVIDPPEGTGPVTDPDELIQIGLWEDGEPIEARESGPHGCAVGASESGKSTYQHGLTAQRSRRKHVVQWAAGMSKFEIFIEPWMRPVIDGRASRPVFDMIGGGSNGTDAEFWSAAAVLAAAHTLMTYRMASPDTPRRNGTMIVSEAHPRVITQLDEVDVLLKYKIANKRGELVRPRFRVFGGRELTVWDMMLDIGSKGRSEGVELDIATQRITDDFWGVPTRSLLNNVQRRAVFYTASSQDSGYLLKNSKQDASLLRNHAMCLSLKGDAKPLKGKAYFYDDDQDVPAEYAIRADQADTIGCLSGAEAQALAELYSERWSPERVGSIARYFGGRIGDLVTLDPEDGAPATSTTSTSSQAPDAEDTDDGEERQQRTDGRQALRDAIAKATGNPSKPATNDPLRTTLDEIRNLPTIDDEQRNTHRRPVPEPLRSVIELFADHVGHLASEHIAVQLGRVAANADQAEREAAATAVANELRSITGQTTDQRRNAQYYGTRRTRGYLIEELRAAAERIARGEDPTPPQQP